MKPEHHTLCDYHFDQYDFECTCGATAPKAAWFDDIAGRNSPVAPSHDWQAIARDLAGALDACSDQLEQMRGLFADDDGKIARAVEDADEAIEAYRVAASTP
jgi:hypothetical protein